MESPSKIFFLLFGFFILSHAVFSQSGSADSLKTALKNASPDSTRCRILNALIATEDQDELKYIQQLQSIAENGLKSSSQKTSDQKFYKTQLALALNSLSRFYLSKGNAIEAVDPAKKSLDLWLEIGNNRGPASCYGNLGLAYHQLGETSIAISYFEKSLQILQTSGDKGAYAQCLNNMALLYYQQGDVAKAIETNSKSLKINEELKDKNGVAQSLNNLAMIYHGQGEFDKSLDFFIKSKNVCEETGNKKNLGAALNNIAQIYLEKGEVDNALNYLNLCVKLKEEVGDKDGLAIAFNNIGFALTNSNPKKALEYFEKSLELRKEIGQKDGIATVLNDIGWLYFDQKKYAQAEQYGQNALQISREIGYPGRIKDAAELLYNVYKNSGKHKLALENYLLFVRMQDSITNESTRKATIRSQIKYEYEKKTTADSVAHSKERDLKNAELAKQKAEIEAKKNLQYALSGGLCLVLVFAGFIFNRFRITQKQKHIIEEQKQTVEFQKQLVDEKQKEILDSIQYAKRIQTALLPAERFFSKTLERLRSLNK